MHEERGPLLTPHRSDSRWPAEKKVETCTNEMCQHDKQYPCHFVPALRRFMCCAVYNHPEPEDGPQQTDQQEQEEHAQLNEMKTWHREGSFHW
jgi:hypothetical protein